MKIAVVTVVSGRHEHLRSQLRGLAESSVYAHHVVVAMGDGHVAAVVESMGSTAEVVALPACVGPLPLARARNLGARTALDTGADLVVFLDVDCIPAPDLLARYAAAAPEHPDALLCGPVTYLPPNPAGWSADELRRATDPHPARPDPAEGTVTVGDDYDLFWSLSFAVTPRTWSAIGGFHEGYAGYGGEDTDFAATARSAGIGVRWVGGAHAYHQHHPVSSPPVEHVDDIVVNSALFHRRWGRWPMEGWLSEFERQGLIERGADGTIRRVQNHG